MITFCIFGYVLVGLVLSTWSNYHTPENGIAEWVAGLVLWPVCLCIMVYFWANGHRGQK